MGVGSSETATANDTGRECDGAVLPVTPVEDLRFSPALPSVCFLLLLLCLQILFPEGPLISLKAIQSFKSAVIFDSAFSWKTETPKTGSFTTVRAHQQPTLRQQPLVLMLLTKYPD
ncbi:hypothetical protein CEXT_615061 [Caerostris extrusa]|uniref:Uncharacterized protein n=1 Tax=Caerostris extrusa TaxID=172846 RepID=A0AAV4XDM4_CAEEX|nr:hypothetical protein CEXT_615061 [Caerostris extrusa]